MKKRNDISAPEKLEKNLLKIFPTLDEDEQSMLLVKDEAPWPDWCYLPMAASTAIATRGAEEEFVSRYILNTGIDLLWKISTILPWRLNKVIYRFDEDLAKELTENSVDVENVPVDILFRLPFPCVYIENPTGAEHCDGLFCFLEYDYRYPNTVELRMHYLFSDGDMICIFHQWTNDKDKLFNEMSLNAAKMEEKVRGSNFGYNKSEKFVEYSELSKKHLNLLLYLCSDEPDLERRNPIPRKRSRGNTVFAAYADKIEVGSYIGSVIRKGKNVAVEPKQSASKTPSPHRPHMRKAHWHLYWTGAGRKIPRVKWISPIFVKGEGSSIPVVTHDVRE